MSATLEPNASPSTETSLAGYVESLEREGFTCALEILPNATVRCHDCARYGRSSDLHVESFRRFEGASDPDDMQIVAAVRWVGAECAGVLVLGFGPMASAEHKRALASLQLERGDHRPQ